jgi:hypothetical protein
MSDNIIINTTTENINLSVSTTTDVYSLSVINVDGASRWGLIVGTLSAQTDLWNNLSAKALNIDLKSLSSNVIAINTFLNLVSGTWNGGFDAYTTVSTNSAYWNYQGTDLKALSSNWQSAYTWVNSNSANATFQTISAVSLSGVFYGDGSNLIGASLPGQASINTLVRSNSANWDSAYASTTALNLSSGFWNSAYNIATDYQSISSSFATNTALNAASATLLPTTVYQNTSGSFATNTLLQSTSALLTPLTLTDTLTSQLVKTTDLNSLSATLLTRTDYSSSSATLLPTTVYQNASGSFATNTLLKSTSALLTPLTLTSNLTSQLVTNNTFNIYQTSVAASTATLLPTSIYRSASGNWQDTFTLVQSNSANWDSAYNVATTYQNASGSFATNNYVNNNFLNLSGGLVSGPVRINNDLTVFGNLTATGTTTFANTIFSVTSSLSVVHIGSGPALWVGNNGDGDIASFYDIDQGIEVFHVGGNNGSFPNVGVKTSTPNVDFTVNGQISANNTIWSANGNSNNWNSAFNISTTYQNASGSFATNTLLQNTSALLTPLTLTRTLTSQLVLNTDSRLSDARTPTAHAYTHNQYEGDSIAVPYYSIETIQILEGSNIIPVGVIGRTNDYGGAQWIGTTSTGQTFLVAFNQNNARWVFCQGSNSAAYDDPPFWEPDISTIYSQSSPSYEWPWAVNADDWTDTIRQYSNGIKLRRGAFATAPLDQYGNRGVANTYAISDHTHPLPTVQQIGAISQTDFNNYRTGVAASTATLLPTTVYRSASGSFATNTLLQSTSALLTPLTLTRTLTSQLVLNTAINSLTGNWNSAYTSTTALNLSSGNWNSTFTTLCANSATWVKFQPLVYNADNASDVYVNGVRFFVSAPGSYYEYRPPGDTFPFYLIREEGVRWWYRVANNSEEGYENIASSNNDAAYPWLASWTGIAILKAPTQDRIVPKPLSAADPFGSTLYFEGSSIYAAKADHSHVYPTPVQIGAAPTVHTHTISQVTNLQTTLNDKLNASAVPDTIWRFQDDVIPGFTPNVGSIIPVNGNNNIIKSDYSIVNAGQNNVIFNNQSIEDYLAYYGYGPSGYVYGSIIAGGNNNNIGANSSNTIVYDYENDFYTGDVFYANIYNSSILGGLYNTISAVNPAQIPNSIFTANYNTIVGGVSGLIYNGDYNFIGGGRRNTVYGNYINILGGQNNTLSGTNSFILGSNISVSANNYTFVNNLSSLGAVHGKFYGDGSNLTGISGGGGSSAYSLVNANFNALVNQKYIVDTTSISVVGTLPSTPSLGDNILFVDSYNNWGSKPLILNNNGNLLQTFNEPLTANISGYQFQLVYVGGVYGWKIV